MYLGPDGRPNGRPAGRTHLEEVAVFPGLVWCVFGGAQGVPYRLQVDRLVGQITSCASEFRDRLFSEPSSIIQLAGFETLVRRR